MFGGSLAWLVLVCICNIIMLKFQLYIRPASSRGPCTFDKVVHTHKIAEKRGSQITKHLDYKYMGVLSSCFHLNCKCNCLHILFYFFSNYHKYFSIAN